MDIERTFYIRKTFDIGYGKQVTIKPDKYHSSNLTNNNDKHIFILNGEENDNQYGIQYLYSIENDNLVLKKQLAFRDKTLRVSKWFDGFIVYNSSYGNEGDFYIYDKNINLEFTGKYPFGNQVLERLWDKPMNGEIGSFAINKYTVIEYFISNYNNSRSIATRSDDLKNIQSGISYQENALNIEKDAKLINCKVETVDNINAIFTLNFIEYDGSSKEIKFKLHLKK